MNESSEDSALRCYVRNRAACRPAAEYERFDPSIAFWIVSNATEAAGRCDGRAFRRVRRPGLPWCKWLGRDTRIADDHALQAFFELHAREEHDWNRLLKEVSRNGRKALHNWRSEGDNILSRLRAQQGAGPNVRLPSSLADEFRIPGKGMRNLRKMLVQA